VSGGGERHNVRTTYRENRTTDSKFEREKHRQHGHFIIPRRSQCPSRLKHVLSSATRTLGSWVRIPLEAWMCVRVFLCCVVLCVARGLALGRSPAQGVLQTVQ